MNLELRNLKLHLLTEDQPDIYYAIGGVDLYDSHGRIVATAVVDIPRCYYDEEKAELIALGNNEGVD